ncbi:thermonuclease family protein [Desulfomonile tiedjei]|uniref:Micrococcal nuclease-like nuclease n=1 Tax=Desulfomonile tiedjei (strain ATCC 49306 / DSM 6799 / DCB-1) TaxID=706587 RepID=I4CCL0_DESTA|nr:thermonuclease family protein [Desulfomonile tiedjei]AFM27301.1 micrococcal nuclease-like nuclease [Desulfomonile tiedjei DSM 6799]
MAKLRLQGEWKMWLGIGILLLGVVLYLYFASRPPMEGGEYLWRVEKVEDDKTILARGSGSEIHMRLIGLKIPKNQEAAAKDYLTKTLETKWVRFKPIRDKGKDLKEGFVFISGEEINARMIRMGLAEIDREETAFDIRPYIELEQEAKREKRGMWSQPGSGAK